jgi:glyoxylase I family protein
MGLTGVHHIALTVSDLDRTFAWYRDVLGFEDMIRYRNDAIHRTYHVLTHPDLDGFMLALVQCDESTGNPFDEDRIGLDHFSLGVGDRGELDEWQRRLDREGISYSVTELPELAVLVFRDPDDIQLELSTPVVGAESFSVEGG